MKKCTFTLLMVVMMICIPWEKAVAQTTIANTAEFVSKIRGQNGTGANFILTADIDLSPGALALAGYPNGWVPLPLVADGDPRSVNTAGTISFDGTLDGNGFAIIGLEYAAPAVNVPIVSAVWANTQNIGGGLFLRLAVGAQIKNLEIRDFKITGNHMVGALAGHVTISGTRETVIENVSVVNCTITGGNMVGGLVGSTNNNTQNFLIRNCYIDETTTITGNNKVGGILGTFGQASGSTYISNCYVAATIGTTGVNIPYGLIGDFDLGTGNTNVNNVFVMAKQTGTTALQPFCVNYNSGSPVRLSGTSASYFACISPGYFTTTQVPATANQKTICDLISPTAYSGVGWQFGTTAAVPWKMESGRFPILYHETYSPLGDQKAVDAAKNMIQCHTFDALQFQDISIVADIKPWLVSQINSLIASTSVTVTEADITTSSVVMPAGGVAGSFNFSVSLTKGSGSETANNSGTIQPITEIRTAQALRDIVTNGMGKYYLLLNDIPMPATDWLPIGVTNPNDRNNATTGTGFTGTLNGNGFAIIGMNCSYSGSAPTGVAGDNITGGLFLRMLGTVKNLEFRSCTVTGHGGGALAGILVGNGLTTIENVSVVGCNISGGSELGGIASKALNTSELSIWNCYVDTTTIIDGVGKVGGIIGNVIAGCTIAVRNCYVAASIKATTGNPYGLVGNFETAANNARVSANNVFVMAKQLAGSTALQQFCVNTSPERLISSANNSVCTSTGYFASATAPFTGISVTDLRLQSTYTGRGWLFGGTFAAPWWIEDNTIFPKFYWQITDAEFVAAAKALVDAATVFTVAQATANDETAVKAWLVGQINSLITSTGVDAVTAANISFNSFEEATTGLSNGSFNFNVVLSKGIASTTATNSGTIWQESSVNINAQPTDPWNITGSNGRIEVTAFEPLFLSVCDISGKVLFAGQIDNFISIPANKGVYILKLKRSEKEAVEKVKKLLVR